MTPAVLFWALAFLAVGIGLPGNLNPIRSGLITTAFVFILAGVMVEIHERFDRIETAIGQCECEP